MLRSKSLKTGVSAGKSAQKPRFCARNGRKWGFRRVKAHKNPDFVLGKPENGGANGKSAQKPRFCARNGRKRGFRRVKAHKNLDFVLEKPENEGLGGQKRTKPSILCSKCPKTGVPKGKSAQKPRFCAREEGKVASGSVTVVWNAKPWPGMQTRGPKMQEGGLNLGHPLGWLCERCERCVANDALRVLSLCAANDALRTMRCERCTAGAGAAAKAR